MRRSILTSVLYTLPVAHLEGREAAWWASGPRKLLPVEAWLESAALAVGTELPRCDHRRPGPAGRAYREAAEALGGSCRWTPARRPSIGVIEAQRAMAVQLCDAGTRVVPLRYDFPAAAEPPRGADLWAGCNRRRAYAAGGRHGGVRGRWRLRDGGTMRCAGRARSCSRRWSS